MCDDGERFRVARGFRLLDIAAESERNVCAQAAAVGECEKRYRSADAALRRFAVVQFG